LDLLQIQLGNLEEAEAVIVKGWENFDLQWQTYAVCWLFTHPPGFER
jgi:hypothetical protein